MHDPHLRIGELSRRSGVAVELLRAWERRYGLLQPSRSPGGFRLYSGADERRVRLMLEHLDRGLAAAEAAGAARAEASESPDAAPGETLLAAEGRRLRHALDRLDENAAHAALDSLLAAFTLETVLRDVVLPYLAELGNRWARGDATIAQEHFASNVLRGRLLALARNWNRGNGKRALLACAPGELHDLALIAFGLVLANRGWRVTFLGPDTPVETLVEAGTVLRPDAIVLAATLPERLQGCDDELASIARTTRLYLAGAGATESGAEAIGADLLRDDPVSAAGQLANTATAEPGVNADA